MTSETPVKTILVLSANPKGTQLLRLGEEIREIKQALREARQRDRFKIESAEAVRDIHIHGSILHYEPQIIHFSGHGTGEPGLAFEDSTGQQKLVDAEALAGLFELFADQVKCVVLNACYSEIQAKAIAQHIDYVIGMSQEIGDKAAIKFTTGFYGALGAGRDFEFAYKLGCRVIRIAGIPEHLTPQLLSKGKGGKNVNTTTVPLTSSPQDTHKEAIVSLEQQEAQGLQEEETDDLSSDVGVDYTQLRDLLKAGEWKEADEETLAVMLKVAGRKEEGWLDINSIKNFPCTDLHTIDQLWVQYSDGRFGFSVQKRIYNNVKKDYEQFSDRIGWRVKGKWIAYRGVTYNTTAPLGHLPHLQWRFLDVVTHLRGTSDFSFSLYEATEAGGGEVSLLSRPDL
ncbi:MAG: GUN4 domain-containing protein [Calothrix sp. MO_167.B42]|nr:GUN4 domain-containing protein [Calothrix sp. MO_167.B42]